MSSNNTTTEGAEMNKSFADLLNGRPDGNADDSARVADARERNRKLFRALAAEARSLVLEDEARRFDERAERGEM
jgi:hypothetical protein